MRVIGREGAHHGVGWEMLACAVRYSGYRTKICEDDVFTPVSQSFCSLGGGGFCIQESLHLGGLHPWGKGVCILRGGRLGRHPSPRYHGIRSTSGRYASYWNAFLFKIFLSFFLDGSSFLPAFVETSFQCFFCIKTHSHPLNTPRVHNRKLPTINRFVQERYTRFA